jgi:hypothetical protein
MTPFGKQANFTMGTPLNVYQMTQTPHIQYEDVDHHSRSPDTPYSDFSYL